jgi:uncharacterized membrane protein YraQ (UPF0718 family)
MIIDQLIQTLMHFLRLTGVLVGLFIGVTFLVGLIQEYVPLDKMQRALNSVKSPWSNVIGAAFGALTPFCSCSTIPMVIGFINAGAPFGASMSFLIASPILNPVIIALMLTLFGWEITTFYILFAFIAAVVTGIVWDKLGLRSSVKRVKVVGLSSSDSPNNQPNTGLNSTWWSKNKPHIVGATSFALNLFRQLVLYLVLGAAIGSVIHGFVPEEFIVKVAGSDNLAAIPVAAVIGVPLYIRASTIIPISASLLGKGMGIGAVIALIIGGAGASIPEVALLTAIFKRKLVIFFVVTVFAVATTAGFIANALLA